MNTNNMHVSVGGGDYTLKAAKLTNNEFMLKQLKKAGPQYFCLSFRMNKKSLLCAALYSVC